MKAFHPRSTVEQLAEHLREEILRGRLHGAMPGVHELVKKLGCSPNTVMSAVRLLEEEGLLLNQGSGRRSRIVVPRGKRPPGLRIEIMLYEKADVAMPYIVEMKHRLMEAGHVTNYSPKTLHDLDLEVQKVARHAARIKTDAWVVVAGSHEVLSWFAARKTPALALFGQMDDLPMAGLYPRKGPALVEMVSRLTALGHRRIVLLVREERRQPQPGTIERRFLELLEERGVRTGPYNLPDWEENAEGLCRCLDSLFQVTPPTALIIDEAAPFTTARMHLAQRGIMTPRDVSMICLDIDPAFEWSSPAVSHVSWDAEAMQRRVMQWANNVARNRKDHRKTKLNARFIVGGTIGPAPNGV